MKINFLGHASLLVETQDCKILMDPLLWDPFCDGTNASCPQREIFPDLLPPYDFLVISHRHTDHFDIRSLAYLPKHIDVLIPPDKLLVECLQNLGYKHIYPLKEFQKVKMGDTTMMTTRSEVRVPEFGMIFADPSGVFWNAVDTFFAPATIERVKQSFPKIDIFLPPWNVGMESKYQTNQGLGFPFDVYDHLYHLISLVTPQAIIPGAQGWKYIDSGDWQNQIAFPQTRERFCKDMVTVLPEAQVCSLDPGDIAELDEDSGFHHKSAACSYARMVIDDRETIAFSPVNFHKDLHDSNLLGYPLETLEEAISTEVTIHLTTFIQEHLSNAFAEHQHWQVIYQLEVVFPDRKNKIWHIDFRKSPLTAEEGYNPLANLFFYITASGFYSLSQKTHGWEYLVNTGAYRHFHKVYLPNAKGILSAKSEQIIDPLFLKYPKNEDELLRLESMSADLHQSDPSPLSNTGMMLLANTFFKLRSKPQSPSIS
jgi:UDP-MurNAc hydroxylase